MKFHQLIEQFIDARDDYNNFEDNEYVSNKENQRQNNLRKDRYKEAAEKLDNAYELLLPTEA